MKRTVKTIIRTTISLLALLLASCTVGLGDAVDTANPTVELSYPPKNAVIRESFIASGVCDDDLKVESVQVTVTETSSKKVYGPYDATLDEEGKNWTVSLNQKASTQYSSFEAYKQWEFPDGNYIVSAVAYDKKKNASPESSVPVSIDNTPPVLLVSKPLAVGTEKASVYGRTLNIVGDISEEHETSKLTLYYKEYDESNPASFAAAQTKTLEITGFGTMSSDSPLTIAKLAEDNSEDLEAGILSQNYKAIYGQETIDTTQSNKKLFYCGFLLEDSAKVYQTPGDTGVAGGNQTTNYYILSDNFNENLFSENTYSLNARNLMLLLSGKSSYTDAQKTQITNLLQNRGNSASSTNITSADSTKFSVDPKNNPMWSITNFDITNGNFCDYEVGSAIPLVLEAGGDGNSVDKKSIEVVLYHLDTDTKERLEHTVIIQKGTYEEGMLKEKIQNQSLTINNYYEIDVTGADVDGNELDSKNGRYGFKRYSTFAPPSVTFETADGCIKENEFINTATLDSTAGIKIKGKIVTANKDLSVDQANVVLKKITAGGKTVPGGENGNYDFVVESFTKDSDGNENSGKIYYFIGKIKAKAGKSLDVNSSDSGSHKYIVSFGVTDSVLGGKDESYDFEFKLDNAKPVISGITASPTVPDGDKSYVNGEIKISGTISDVGSGIKTLKYGINTTSSASAKDITNKISGANWLFEYDTTKKADNTAQPDGTYILHLYATDDSKNETDISYTLNIKQETDKPVITFTNIENNIFTKSSNKLIGSVTDDDGLNSVTINWERTSPDSATGEISLTGYVDKTSYSINAELPEEEGEYTITVVAKDNVERASATDTAGTHNVEFHVIKDEGAPEIKITSPNSNSQNYYPGSVTVEGTAKEGSADVTITRTVKKGGSSVSSLTKNDITIANSTTTQKQAIIDGTATWTDTIDFTNAGTGTYEISYTAEDPHDQVSDVKTVTVKVDVKKPTIGTVKLDDTTLTSDTNWSNKNDVTLKVTATDTGTGESGVASVKYDKGDNNWKNMVLNDSTWEADIILADSDTNTLRVKAIDNAGNESEIKTYSNIKIDTVAPAIAISNTTLTGNVYVNKKTDQTFTVSVTDEHSDFDSLKIFIGNTEFKDDKVTKTETSITNGKKYVVTIKKLDLIDGALKITAKDNAGNESETDICTFIVDTTAPVISNISLIMKKDSTSVNAYKNADGDFFIRNTKDGKLTISGIATDNKEFKKITLNVAGTGITTINKTSTDSSWKFENLDLSSGSQKATVTLTAYDEIDNVKEETFDIIFDETKPIIVTDKVKASYTFRGNDVYKDNNLLMGEAERQGRYSESSYGRSSATKFTVYLNDAATATADSGSGLSKLEYKLWASDKEDKTQDELKTAFDKASGTTGSLSWSSSGSFTLSHNESYTYKGSSVTGTKAEANISGFKPTDTKDNYLLLRPIDNCGNAGDFTVLKIKIDQTAPEVIATPVDKLTNGTTPMTITGTVTDSAAGLKALHVYINDDLVMTINSENAPTLEDGKYSFTSPDGYGTISYTADYNFSEAPSSADWTLTLTPAVGNWFRAFGDNDTPIVKILAEDWAELNGVGNKAPNPTKVAVIKKDTTDPTVTITSPANNSKVNGVYKITGTSSDTNPAKLAVYYAKKTSTVTTAPTAIDGYTPITGAEKIVGQNDVTLAQLANYSFDVNFFDSNLIDAASVDSGEKQDVWILVQATDEAGNTSAISPYEYTIDRNEDRPTVTISDKDFTGMSSSNYKKVIFGESKVYVSISDDDGIKTAQYRINSGSWQNITLNSGTGSIDLGAEGQKLIEFKITDTQDGVFESSASKLWNKVYLEDSEGHKLGNTQSQDAKIYATLDKAPPSLNFKGIKAPGDTAYEAPQDFNRTLGGTINQIELEVDASDDGSDIACVKAITHIEGKETSDDVTVSVDSPETQGGSTYKLTVSCDETRFNGTGTLKLTVIAVDNAGKERSTEKQFNIDNLKPGITVSTPERNSEQSGSISVSGYFTESVKFSYAISPISASPDTYTAATTFNFIKNGDNAHPVVLPTKDKSNNTISPSSALKDLCKYVEYSDESISTFYLYLDGSETSSAHSALLNTWLTRIGITTTTDLGLNTGSFDDIITLYLHLKAQDEAGNVYEEAYPILVDPQGNRPKVDFSYPSSDMGDSPILGGELNIIGSATGKNQVTKVYMQIDTNGDGNWNSTDETYLSSNGKHNYTLVSIPWLSGQKGIEITVNGTSWNQQINVNGEFNPTTTGQTRPITLRLFALDNQGTHSSAKTKTILIDSDVPVIGQNLQLVQWNSTYSGSNGYSVDTNGNITFATGAVKALREYKDGMYVTGAWDLVGIVRDDGGISKITIDGNKEDGTNITGGNNVKAYTKTVSGKTITNYAFCLPIGSDSGVGQSTIPFYAKDNDKSSVSKTFIVNYDNTAPVVTPVTESMKKVLNNNGYYKLSSVATEDSVNGANQSGVERIAFFFTRNTDEEPNVIFDPMIKSGATGNKVNYTGTLEDGLYWQSATVSSVNGTSLTMANNTDFTNIHVGGLAKVNGTIYRIQSITGKTITLSGTPGTATSVKFAIANVIDSTSPEDVPDSNVPTGTNNYGYGYADPDSDIAPWDDGDLMPERCITTGTQCNWEANINSKNMTDGPVTLHYVVFDKAGNYNALTAECVVQNNSPRLAGAYIGTDEDGNGTVDWSSTTKNGFNGEFKAYHELFKNGYDALTKVTELTIPAADSNGNRECAITVKRDLAIRPEIIGGIGAVGYTYKVGSYDSAPTVKPLGTGTGDSNNLINLGTNQILITVKDLLEHVLDGERDFIFTIWDTTPGLTPGVNSQSATLNVRLDVDLWDVLPAQNKIIPFYWNSKEDNSLKDNSTALGHIELSKDLPGDTFKSTNSASTIYTLNPKISGAIKLEGIAQDNSLIKSLSVKIGSRESIVIATYETNGTWTEGTGTGWTASIRQATYDELLAAEYIYLPDYNELIAAGIKGTDKVPYASQEFGHVVHWIMNIDTQAMGLTPSAGIEITVSAADYGRPTLSGSTVNYNNSNEFENNWDGNSPDQTGGDDGTDDYTCRYTVDLVPYIRGIKTALSKKSKKEDTSEYDRTSLGHYPVASTETIVINGFNLGGKVKFTSNDENAAEVNYNASGIAIPSNAKSGEISIINGVESLNNKNRNDAKGSYTGTIPTAASTFGDEDTYEIFTNCYNRMPNTTNNYILTDDVVLDVWQFNSEATKPARSGVISDPVMKINPDSGIIGFAYQSGDRRFSMADKTNSYQLWVGDYDNLSATGFAYDSAGNAYGTACGGDINSSPSVSKFVFLSSIWGQSGTEDNGALGGSNSRRIEQIGQVGTKADTNNGAIGTITYVKDSNDKIDKNRFVSPSIAVSGSGGNAKVYLVYYDKMNQEIRFKWASGPQKASNANDNKFWSGTSYINDRYTEGNLGTNTEIQNQSGKTVDPDNYCLLDFQIIAEKITGTTTSLGTPGPYVALDVIPSGTITGITYDIVVMVWYDETNGNLMYTYNKTNLGNVAAANFEGSANTKTHWQTPSTIFTGAGQYCQIKTDIAGGVHIVAYDHLSGDVRYAKLTSYAVTPNGATGTTKYNEDTMSCVVDSSGIVGSNLTLDVAYDKASASGGHAIPYIGYYGSIGPKMAYLTSEGAALSTVAASAGTVKDMFTGYWDVTEVPTPSNAPKDRINVGIWKNASTGVIKASSSGTTTHANTNGTESDNGKTYGNGTTNPVVAYEIRPSSAHGYMETAQKK